MNLNAIITLAPEGGFVAYDPKTRTTTQGETKSEAFCNLQEAKELFLEVMIESKTQ